MKTVSKGFFLGSIAGGLGLAMVIIIIASLRMTGGYSESELGLLGLACIPMLYGAIVNLVLWYRAWAAIQDGHARTTPGKAVGFLFLPLFNIYWAFQAVWGLSKDFNAYTVRHSISATPLPEVMFLTYCILCLTTWIPIVGLLLMVVNFVIGLIMVSALCDGINAVATAPPQQGVPGPQPV